MVVYLMRKKLGELFALGLDHYQYSLMPQQRSYERLVQADHFNKVDENFKRIIKLRDELSAKTKITSHIMKFKETEEFFKEFKEEREKYLNKELGDEIHLRKVGNWGGETWGLDKNLNNAGFTYEEDRIPEKRYPCTSIFMHFKLNFDGRYAPCVTAVPDSSPSEELHKVKYIGDAREITWTEAWQKMHAMREIHLRGDWDSIEACKSCNIWSLWDNTFNESHDGIFSHQDS